MPNNGTLAKPNPARPPNQCENVANTWAVKMGVQQFTGNAIDAAGQVNPDFEWIRNTPNNWPARRDIIVFGFMPGVTGPNGHISVCLHANIEDILSFDQNWPDGAPCHRVGHGYAGVLGWQHPRVSGLPPA